MKLIVVGAGLAGTWLTLAAQNAGHRVTLVSDGEPSADTAALAMIRPSYLPRHERPLLHRALEHWDLVSEVVRGARVTRWNDDSVKQQKDWFAIRPELPSVEPDERIRAHASPVSPTGVWTGRDYVEGDAVVWCDGAGEGRRTYGSTWVHRDPAALAEPFQVHHVAPYKALAAVRYEDHARLGSSSASSLDAALRMADKFLDVALDVGLIASPKGWRRVDGSRLQHEPYLRHTEHGWRWAGFHRNGFALVPTLAPTVVEAVELG